MRNEPKGGLLVIGHGSRREEANDDVREATRLIGERGGASLVEWAFLEIASPNILESFTHLVERGARSVTVHPYFLSPGRHTRGDVPIKVAEAAALHPGVSYRITEPLSGHDLVIQASIERIRETETSQTEFFQTNAFSFRKEESNIAKGGTVYLVGAGPGDPGLLTICATELLRSCDVVIYDSLVNPVILELVPPKAKRIYVGKIGGGRQTPQSEINHLLINYARSGKRVVRLKGGDPFIFGRGGEEAGALKDAGIKFEVVPGISSALAVPAYAGIPLTHRGLSSSVAVLTGAKAGDGKTNLEAITSNAGGADTLVILMGSTHLRVIALQLIDSGRSASTPVAVIRWGTYEGQETITGTLQTIADDAEKANLRAPSVIVVGEVVRLRKRLNWFETVPASFRLEEKFTLATGVAV